MPRRKRPYVPKTKGCYECSQRRVHCDRTQPQCEKCVARNIPCSGYGIRYRFRSCPDTSKTYPQSHNTPRRSQTKRGDSQNISHTNTDQLKPPESCCTGLEEDAIHSSHTGDMEHPHDAELIRCLDFMQAINEFLLTHFSDNISPQMVVMDDVHNGWRYIVLSIAWSDELVMNAVSAVAAYHLAQTVGAHFLDIDPDQLYSQVIRGLKERNDLRNRDVDFRRSIVLTIAVLLVGMMVNSSSDFPVIFRMLQSALDAVGGERGLGEGEVTDFLSRQIHKMRVYAAPLLSQEAGVHSIRSYAKESFDCLYYYCTMHPTLSSAFYLVADLRQQAYNIYLTRASLGTTGTMSSDMIARHKQTLQSLPPGLPGEHSLVWSTFIAASESLLSEHREYFRGFLQKQYFCNGFSNILQALKLLDRIWAGEHHGNWPTLLPEPRVFIM